MKKQVKKQMKKQYMPAVIVCILILLLAVAGIGAAVIKKYIPTKERMDLNEYYGQAAEGEAVIVLGIEIMEERAVTSNGQTFLPLELVNNRLNQRYYWDSGNSQILYATPSELQTYPASENGETEVWLREGAVYLSLPFVQKYTDMDVYVGENPSRVIIQNQFTGVNTATVKKDTYVRYRGGIKSPVLTQTSQGDTLIYMKEYEEWVQVATMDGYIGFVKKEDISPAEIRDFEREFQAEEYQHLSMDVPVNLSWHQVTSAEANSYFADAVANVSGVNVISPTWFYLTDTAGNIADISSADYVQQAHDRGMKVWGLIDNFTADVSTTDTLSQLSSRQNIISQLMAAAERVKLDGINIDFETLSEDAGPHFLQFLREISIECHKRNLVLSVDNPVPEDFTSHYDRGEQGEVVDYVIIMGYDEHYVGSEEAGSVASLPWVEKGVADTLTEVPAERTILAIPFYTRLWKTTGGALTSEAIGMDQAQNVLAENQAEPIWDGSVGQNKASFEKEGSSYDIWLEDAQSIAEKVKLIPKYKLAGVAQWKLGFENSSIWQVISDNLQ
nr:glycosyl hydrolase family 18 protein [uncultured Blautia sp.]